MTAHETVCHVASEAISEVFGDTSVPREKTLESLGNLKDTIATYMETWRMRFAASHRPSRHSRGGRFTSRSRD